jgi:hypothetical protein
MGFDWRSVPGAVLSGLTGLAIGVVGSHLWFNISTGDEFMFNGQAFGFAKKYSDLEAIDQKKAAQIAAMSLELESAKNEILKLGTLSTQLVQEKKDKERHQASTWLPVDEIVFSSDGQFESKTKQGKGRWASAESDVTLKLVSLDEEEAVFELNFPPPHNRWRFTTAEPVMTFTGVKYEFSVTAYFHPYSSHVEIRVDRRPKQQPQ